MNNVTTRPAATVPGRPAKQTAKFAAMLAATFVSALCLTAPTGCKTTDGGRVIVNTNAVLQAAVIFKASAREAALAALEENPDSERWFWLAQSAIGQFTEGAVHDPAAFKAALARLPKLDDKWTRLIANSLADAYELYYLNFAAPINHKTTAGWISATFLKAIQEGFIDALATLRPPSGAPDSLERAKEWLKSCKVPAK